MSFKDINLRDVTTNAMTFMVAHTGCMAAPVISTVTSGIIPPQAGLVTAISFSLVGMLGMDEWIRRVKPIGCARCVSAKADVFKRQGKLMLQAIGIGALMHVYNGATDHDHSKGHAEDHINGTRIETAADGRQMMIRDNLLCGPQGTIQRTDTIYLSPLKHEYKNDQ